MKKIIIFFIVLTPLLAQNNLNQNYLSVNLSPLSLSCSYELSISNEIKILNKISAKSALSYSEVYGGLSFATSPKISIAPRYYYNLEERKSKNKNIKNNSANYLTIEINYLSNYEIINNNPDNYELNNTFGIESRWGLKRMISSNLFFETNLGIGLYFVNDDNWETVFWPAGTFKLGWNFN